MRRDLERVYREHRQGLFTLALSITRCVASAEDSVHAAFERLWRAGRSAPTNLVAYVYSAVRNAALDQVRRGQAREKAQAELGAAASIYDGVAGPASAEAVAAETATALRRAVDDLPDDQREAVVLRIYGQLTFEQMAETLGEPLATVASRYRRALEALRQRMEGLQ